MRLKKIELSEWTQYCSIILLLSFTTVISGQDYFEDQKPRFIDRTYFGGYFNLSFGTYTYVNISPTMEYMLTDRLSIGIGGMYEFYRDRTVNFETSIYGGNLFSRYIIVQDLSEIIPFISSTSLLGHVEYEALNLETYYFAPNISWVNQDRFYLHSVLVGGGIKQYFGTRAAVILLVLFNLNQNSFVLPYQNPVLRVGFVF